MPSENFQPEGRPEDEIRRDAPNRRPRLTRDDDDDDDRDLDRIRRDDGGVNTLIPYRNPQALLAYYFGVFSLIPCAGLVLGPVALILGILGLRYKSKHPTAGGTGHAIAGIVLGSLTLMGHLGVILLVTVGSRIG